MCQRPGGLGRLLLPPVPMRVVVSGEPMFGLMPLPLPPVAMEWFVEFFMSSPYPSVAAEASDAVCLGLGAACSSTVDALAFDDSLFGFGACSGVAFELHAYAFAEMFAKPWLNPASVMGRSARRSRVESVMSTPKLLAVPPTTAFWISCSIATRVVSGSRMYAAK
jgi:hypothetical protein